MDETWILQRFLAREEEGLAAKPMRSSAPA